MFYLIDFFVILLISVIVFINYKKGLIGVAVKILSFFIAIIISIVLFKPVSYFLVNATPIDDNINSYVYNFVDDYLSSKDNTDKSSSSNLPKSVTNYIDATVESTKKTIKENVTVTVADNITSTIMNVLSFLVVFMLSRIVLIFVKFLSDRISELPVVKQFNEIGGIIYGFLKAFIILFTVLAIISILPLTTIQTSINKTILTLFLYNINPILWIFF